MSKQNTELKNWRYSSRVRVGAAAICGILVGAAFTHGSSGIVGPLWGWDTASAVYCGWLLMTIFKLDSTQTAKLASEENPSRFTVDVLMILASVVSLGAVGLALVESAKVEGAGKTILLITCVASVVLSWMLVHMTFALRYARLFYDLPQGGVNFNCDEEPCYMDFAYLSFTVGMTFQVSDTEITGAGIRHTVLRHALLSYLFGTVIVATTINLVAGLSK